MTREYCITIFPDHIPQGLSWKPVSPTDTAWGPAYRPGEEGKLLWPGDLHAYIGPSDGGAGIWLPRSLTEPSMQCVAIGGPGIDDFEEQVNASDTHRLHTHPLIDLIRAIIEPQSLWAVVMSKDCDDVGELRHQSIPELIDSVVNAYRHDIKAAGFVALKRD